MSDLVKLPDAATVQQVLIGGDLSKLTEQQRTAYYLKVCESVGLNALTQPFNYLNLNGKLQLYARKDCTDQLRTIRKVSIVKMERETIEGVYVCTAYAVDATGRQDVSTGAVHIDGLKGEARANAMMKSETKSKRRVTLSICGLGMLDETEVETIHGAQVVTVDAAEKPAKPMPTKNGDTMAEWTAKLMTHLRTTDAELADAGKCSRGELLADIEQAWANAGIPDSPKSWTLAHGEAARTVATGIIKAFKTRDGSKEFAAFIENPDADPVDAELENALS